MTISTALPRACTGVAAEQHHGMHKRLCLVGFVATSLLLTGCPEKRRPANSASGKPASSNPGKPAGGEKSTTPGPLGDYARTLDKSEKKAAEVTGLTTLTQAVQQFNVLEGRLPRTLDELVESRYLPKLPPAPRGKRFVYNPKSGDVAVADLQSVAPETKPEIEQLVEPKPETPAPVPATPTATPDAAPLPESGQ
ncbi:MAG: hypothetical protein QM691_00640 [Opitutaceae bacterium]